MSERWFRFYDSALDHPKVQLLSDSLFRTWVNLLCLASRNDGALPTLTDIAFALRMREKSAKQLIAALIAAGLLDDADCGLRPHAWDARQYKSDVSTARVQRFRGRRMERLGNASGNVSSDVSETPPESDSETESETESSSSIDDERLGNELRNAAPGSISAGCTNVSAIKALLDEGCYLELDVLPTVRQRLPALGSPLKTWGAGWLADAIRDARKRRDGRRSGAAASAPKDECGVFIEEGSPEWRAWNAFERSRPGGNPRGLPVKQLGNRRGWPRPSQWPSHASREFDAIVPPGKPALAPAYRLSLDFQPTEPMRAFARSAGLSESDIDAEGEAMRDWSMSSPSGAKLDWEATWREWVRRKTRDNPRSVHAAAQRLQASGIKFGPVPPSAWAEHQRLTACDGDGDGGSPRRLSQRGAGSFDDDSQIAQGEDGGGG